MRKKETFFLIIILFATVTVYPMLRVYRDGEPLNNNIPIRDFDIASFSLFPTYCDNKKLWADKKEFLSQRSAFTFMEPLYEDKELNKQPNLGYNPVVYLRDSTHDAQLFVLKSYAKQNQELAIREALGSFIGASIGKVPIQKVKIIPKSTYFVDVNKLYCIDTPCLATLHTYVPGTKVSLLPGGSGMQLQLSEDGLKKLYYWGNILENSDRWHSDLCKVIALDIFVDNWDRHAGNYNYDAIKKRYYFFDMDRSYSSTYFCVACDALEFLKRHLPHLTAEEKRGLKKVNRTLKKFFSLYSNKMIYELWMQKAKEAEYQYSGIEQNDIKKKICKNNEYVKQLICFIDEQIIISQ